MSVHTINSAQALACRRILPGRRLKEIVLKGVLGILLAGGWILPASAHAQEIQKGTVAYFTGRTCPTGWVSPTYAQGRLILSTTVGSAVGTQRGRPLANLEDRVHNHRYSAPLNIDHKSICGACSCCTGQGANSGSYTVSANTAEVTTGLPFIQYLVCEKS